MKNQIESVDPGSPAQRAGVRPGECLLEIDGKSVTDVLDYKFFGYDRKLTLTLSDAEGRVRRVKLRKAEGEDIGLNFSTYLMDKARSCANRCIFCFVDQMPGGMRESLYFKDDDARLSFLMGNYITMTNLSAREIDRICAMRISPINISVHTTDPELRVKMLRHQNAGRCLETMKRFAQVGITMNCQIVACPGVNDGPALQKSMEDLAGLYPAVSSVAVVPVGLTRYREGLYPLHTYTPEEAAALLSQVEAFAAESRERLGTSLVWCSDEFYLLTGRPLPEDRYYEAYAQLENGVGMLRLLSVEAEGAMEDRETGDTPESFSVACGTSAAPFLEDLIRRAMAPYPDARFSVFPVVNHFFGETVNVSGLLTGQDLIAQLRGRDLGKKLLISENMLRHGENVFLDDVTLARAEEELGVPIVPVPQDGGALIDLIFEPAGEDRVPCAPAATAREEEFYRYNPAKE